MIPFHVAQLAATILDTADRRFPHRYTGLLPYTLAKGIMKRGPNPEKMIYFDSVPDTGRRESEVWAQWQKYREDGVLTYTASS